MAAKHGAKLMTALIFTHSFLKNQASSDQEEMNESPRRREAASILVSRARQPLPQVLLVNKYSLIRQMVFETLKRVALSKSWIRQEDASVYAVQFVAALIKVT